MAHYAQGTYPIEIIGQDFDEGKYGLQFVLRFRVLDGNSEYERSAFLGLLDQDGKPARYVDKTMEVLRHLGFAGDEGKLSILDPRHPSCHSFAGIQGEAYCSHKQRDDGGINERWYINTPRDGGGYEPQQASKDTLRKLDALFGRALKDSAKQAAPPQPPAPHPEDEQQAVAGVDIPF